MVKQALLLALAHILSLVVRRKICAINICIQLATAQAAEHPFQSPGGAPPPLPLVPPNTPWNYQHICQRHCQLTMVLWVGWARTQDAGCRIRRRKGQPLGNGAYYGCSYARVLGHPYRGVLYI